MKQFHSMVSIFVIILLASFALAGCLFIDDDVIGGLGKVITETRQVGFFTEVENTTFAELILDQGQSQAVSIEGYENLVTYFLTELKGDRLTIKTKPNTHILTNKQLIVHITLPQLSGIRMTGSGDADMDRWVGDEVTLETTGSGNITVSSLVARKVSAKLSGSGNIRVDGKVDDLVVWCSGSGNFDSPNLQVSSLDVALSGSGNARVWVTGILLGTLSGSGNLEYYGSPEVTNRLSGSGEMRRLGDAP